MLIGPALQANGILKCLRFSLASQVSVVIMCKTLNLNRGFPNLGVPFGAPYNTDTTIYVGVYIEVPLFGDITKLLPTRNRLNAKTAMPLWHNLAEPVFYRKLTSFRENCGPGGFIGRLATSISNPGVLGACA